ncbi:hypothetical protein MRX96_029941 [Rhipicephalus microplus]
MLTRATMSHRRGEGMASNEAAAVRAPQSDAGVYKSGDGFDGQAPAPYLLARPDRVTDGDFLCDDGRNKRVGETR